MKKALSLILAASLAFGSAQSQYQKNSEPLDKYKDFFPIEENLIIKEYTEKVLSSGSILFHDNLYENRMIFLDTKTKRLVFLFDLKNETSISSKNLIFDKLELIVIRDLILKKDNYFFRGLSGTVEFVEELFKRWDVSYNKEREKIRKRYLKRLENTSHKYFPEI